jgi:hypothetical protein
MFAKNTPSPRATTLWRSEQGDVAVSYLFVVAIAIAIALAVVTLRSPIRRATELATQSLADNNP